jgi:hypothetical protein
VEGAGETELAVGPPFTLKVSEGNDIRSGSVAYLGLDIIDQAGCDVTSVYRGRSRPTAPTLTVVDESGKQVVSGKFEYG